MQSFDYQFSPSTDMETSFYHDNQRDAVKKMKSSMSLDFLGATSSKKRATQTTSDLQPGLLGSPDLNMLKLASPELERMIIQQNGMVTTTPTPSQITNPKFVTEEQEAYARGFVDALAELHTKQGDGHLPMEENGSAVNVAPVSSMTTLLPSAADNMSMSMSDISSGTTMTTTLPPLMSAVPMSSAGYQTQQTSAAIMSMPYTSTADHMNMSTSQSIATSCADMQMPSNSQHQYTTLLPPTSQHQQANTYMPSNIQDNTRIAQLKQEEPQIVPNLGFSPPLSPINMVTQEKIKLERKRERNRVAARKCRTRKLERISRLEDRVTDLKGQNSDLVSTATQLRDQVCKLKSQIMQHVKNGCQVMMSQNLM